LKRHLLAYLYVIGWKGGYLFPSMDELYNPPADGKYKTMMTESTLYSSLKDIFTEVLRRADKLGSHCARKTAYLFGTMRGALLEMLMLAADHDCWAVALRYFKDSESIMQINRVYREPTQALGLWKNPHCSGDETCRIVLSPGTKWQKPLPELAVGFIEIIIGINPNDPQGRQPKYVCDKVVAWMHPGKKPIDELLVSLQTNRANVLMASVMTKY
jgi:hypothetical protein